MRTIHNVQDFNNSNSISSLSINIRLNQIFGLLFQMNDIIIDIGIIIIPYIQIHTRYLKEFQIFTVQYLIQNKYDNPQLSK